MVGKEEMRGLTQYIADLRACRVRELEEKRINKEMAHIRQKFKGTSRRPSLAGSSEPRRGPNGAAAILLHHNYQSTLSSELLLFSSRRGQADTRLGVVTQRAIWTADRRRSECAAELQAINWS